MKILYAVQGTGNGHIRRAAEFIPEFRQHGDVDVLLSGNDVREQPGFDIDYHLKGITYTIGRHGGVDWMKSAGNLGLRRFRRDVRDFPVEKYDLVINDFEPVSAWAARRAGVPCVALSHQAAFLSDRTPRPSSRSTAAEMIFRYFAPCTYYAGMHFRKYDDHIYTPLIRSGVRNLDTSDHGHVTVYLPSCDVMWLFNFFREVKGVRFQVFSSQSRTSFTLGNVELMPLSSNVFLRSLASCHGFITGAGFEAPAEGLFLGKKLLVVPMKNQYEQSCNAAALEKIGVSVEWKIKSDFSARISRWLGQSRAIRENYPDNTQEIVEYVLSRGHSSVPHLPVNASGTTAGTTADNHNEAKTRLPVITRPVTRSEETRQSVSA
jgi:uncharacterized protein (TIGR00661 family)